MSRISRHLTPSLFISLLALVIATSSGAYAAAVLQKGEVKTRHLANGAVTAKKLHSDAVSTKKVQDFSLNLHDFNAKDGLQTRTVGSPIAVAAGSCQVVFLNLYNPAPDALLGSMVVGSVTDATGGPAMSNAGVVVPTMVSETSQGGALVNLVVCASSQQTIASGSIFHYQVIPPGK
jgi:hypothetical protein